MIFILIYFPLIIYMFYDFQKAFLLFVLLKIFLNKYINVINIPGVPLFTLELFTNICFILYFFFLLNKKSKYAREDFPLKTAYIWCISSIIISTIFSVVGFSSAFTRALQDIINNYIYIYILWYILRSKSDVFFLINGFVVIFIILGLYGFFEKTTGINPLIDYEISLNPSLKDVNLRYDLDGRLGLGRVQSAISHPIGFGIYLAIILSFYFFIQNKVANAWRQNIILKLLFCLLSISCLFFTNSRSPLIYLFISVLPMFIFEGKRRFQMILFGLFGLLLTWNIIEPYMQNILSLIDSKASNNVGGSDSAMRYDQFASAIRIFFKSPFIGNGIKSMDDFLDSDMGLLGGESVWIWLMIERGFLGIISHIILIISIAKMGYGKVKYFVWFSTLAWLVTTTITSTPGIDISFFITIILLLNRIQILTVKTNKSAK